MKRNRIIKIGCLLAALGLLSSCGLYGKYERTVTEVADTTSLARFSWKEMFTDPFLQELIGTGLERNTDLKIAQLNVQKAQAALSSVRLAQLPALNFSAQGKLDSAEPYDRSDATWHLPFTADWELDLFGRKTNARRGAKANLLEMEDYRQAVLTQLVAGIADHYYTLLMLDSQLEICQETLGSWERTIHTLEALKQAGKTHDAAVEQAKANRLNLESQAATLEQSIQETENSLSVLLALPPQHIRRGTLADQHFPEDWTTGLPLGLLSGRPDVRQAEHRLEAAFYATQEARSYFYPQINLSGTAGWTNQKGQQIVSPAKSIAQAVASLVQPLFNQGKNRARLQTARLDQEAAALTFQQSLLEAGTEVNDALCIYQTARRKEELEKEKIAHLTEAVRKTRLLMQYSSVNYLEVLTAEQNLLSAQMQQVQNLSDQIHGIIHLYHALGGGIR